MLTVYVQEWILVYIHGIFCQCMRLYACTEEENKIREAAFFRSLPIFRKIKVLSKSSKTHKHASGSMCIPQNTCTDWGKYQLGI